MKDDTLHTADHNKFQRAIRERVESNRPIGQQERLALMQMTAKYDCIGTNPQSLVDCVADALQTAALINDVVDEINEDIKRGVQ